MHAMDENPYAPHFVPCGRHKLESVQFVRLQAAMSECKLQPLQAADAEGIAKKIHWAVTRLNSRTRLESVERAKGEDKCAREIRRCAIKLARLLSTAPATLAASIEQSFDQERFALISPFDLQPMLRELGRGATRHVRWPPRTAVSKVNGRSPMQLFIRELAPHFKVLSGSRATVDPFDMATSTARGRSTCTKTCTSPNPVAPKCRVRVVPSLRR